MLNVHTLQRQAQAHLTAREWQPASGVRSAAGATGPATTIEEAGWNPLAWLEPTIVQIGRVLELESDWNSYRSKSVQQRLVVPMLELLFNIMSDDTPTPSVVPTASGSFQVEWHRNGYDLEIELLSPSRFLAYFHDVSSGDEEALEVISDLGPVVKWVDRVSG